MVGLEEVPLEKVSRYGIVKGERVEMQGVRGETLKLSDLVEKPRIEEAPSRLAIAGRYLLDPAVFDILATQRPGYGGEIQLTDAIRRLLTEKAVYGYRYPGRPSGIRHPRWGYQAFLPAVRQGALLH